jgi:hypothetical protein
MATQMGKRPESMAKRVFISYRHQQAEWVRTTLYPVLSAGGVEVVVDYKKFAAGVAVRRQMKAAQGKADIQLLVLTPDYLQSDYCVEEMNRAFSLDPDFSKGVVLLLVLERCKLPPQIRKLQPLYVDLVGKRREDAEAWKLLMERCEADLGTSVPNWIDCFRRATAALHGRKSVNLFVKGQPKWREFILELKRVFPDIGVVDLEAGKTATQHGLVGEILGTLVNFNGKLPRGVEHLAEFERLLEKAPATILALTHFHIAPKRKYTEDLYHSFRHLVVDHKKLTLLIESRAPFATLLPKDHALSFLDMETVELGSNA